MKIRLGTVAHFSIAVRDSEESAAWWTSLFDLDEFRRTPTQIVVGNDAIAIALNLGRPAPDEREHLAFQVESLAALEFARDRMRTLGVKLEDPGEEIGPIAPGATGMGLWFRDPDNYRWELFVR
jgi:catechol 2,3-dioxygenase-like lactoylglutathione lyase family enzyme